MDLGLAGKGAADEPRAKVRAVAPKQDQQKILTVLAKLCLSNAMTSRAMRAILIESFRIKRENPYLVAHQGVTKAYAGKAKEMRDAGTNNMKVQEELGLPHIHGWNSLIATFKNRIKDQSLLDKVNSFVAFWQDKGWQAQSFYVSHSRVAKMYDRDYLRLEVNVKERVRHQYSLKDVKGEDVMCPYGMWMLIKADLMGMEGVHALEGTAPPGDLEHQLQDWLDQQA